MAESRAPVALSLSLALGLAGCTKSSPEEGGAPESAKATPSEAKTPAKGDETKGDAPQTQTKVAEPVPSTSPGALAAAVEAMIEAEATYAAELDPLLDLLPADSKVFVVVRDVEDLLAVADSTLVPTGPALRAFATAAGGDASDDVDKVFTGYDGMQAALRGADFDLGKGLVIGDVDGDGVVIYGASKPDALPTMLRALGASGDDMPDECAAIEGMAGYVACADDPKTLAKYAPGKAAATVRATLGTQLGATSVDQANLIAHIARDSDPEPITFSMATTPGLAHFTFAIPEMPDEMRTALGKGDSPALGLAAPGSGFYWAKLDSGFIAEQTKDQPFIVQNVVKTLTGELFLGNLAEPDALVVLAGVTDPGPLGGLVAMAGLQTDQIPKTLPDGSSLDVGMETLMIAGKDTQVLHATMKPAGKSGELMAKLGFVPEAWLFSVGGYAGLVLGADKAAVEKIAGYAGGTMSPESAKTLPKPLAKGLVDGEVAVAMHLPIDGLQSPQVSESFAQVAKEMPAEDLPPGTSADQIMRMVQAISAPVSGMSMWMAPPKDQMIVHIAISLMGDPRTEEGKAALAAMATVAGGGDAAAAYGELASKFASSPRATAYSARAGARSDGALASAAMMGMMAAIAVPAFVKYQQRSKSASAEAEAMRAMAEAEAAAAKAAEEARIAAEKAE